MVLTATIEEEKDALVVVLRGIATTKGVRSLQAKWPGPGAFPRAVLQTLGHNQRVQMRLLATDRAARPLARCGGVPPSIVSLLLPEEPPPVVVSVHVPPVAFVGDLRPYQLRAFRFAHGRDRTMLALDMGLGKTVIGIAYAIAHQPALIVCPASLLASWSDHLALFAPSATCSRKTLDASADVTLVSYHRLAKVTNHARFRCIVADECHYLKHAASLRAKAFALLQRSIPCSLFLTGTPAQKHADIFNLLHLMDKRTFPEFYHYRKTAPPGPFYFAERYCVPEPVWLAGRRHGFTFKTNQHTAELRAVCKRYLLRMKKEDVLELPPLRRLSRTVGTLSTARRHAVQAELRRIETVRETRGSLYADVALLALCREMAVEKAPAVYPELRRRSVGEERTIVFFHHKAVGSLYREWLQTEGIPFVFIDGGTPMHARDAIIERWKAPDGPRLGLCSLCATSTGLNLQFCTRILVAEMTFHSTHHTQSEARIYRIGQTKPVEITYLLLAGSTDHMLWSALNRKILVEATLFDDRVPRKRPRVQQEESDIIPL